MPTFTFDAPGGAILDDITTTSSFNVFGTYGNVTAIAITYNGLVHNRAADIDAGLRFNGTLDIFLDDDGGDSNFNGDYTFADNGADFNAVATPLGDGDTIPEGTYAAPDGIGFVGSGSGIGVNGTWDLLTYDDLAGFEGSYASATLSLTTDDLNAYIGGTSGNDTITVTSTSMTGGTMNFNGDTGTYADLMGHFLLRGLDGDDYIVAGATDDVLSGGTGDDTLFGGGGNDQLSGGEGIDAMSGGVGNDTYRVDNIGDTTVETEGNGQDMVVSFGLDWTLADNIENLRLLAPTGMGLAQINGTGNASGNIITGTAGINILAGAAGDDTLYGYRGNDNLFGGADDDTLYGGAGKDNMSGGEGMDTFVFEYLRESSVGGFNADRIIDFVSGEDTIDLSAIDADFNSAGTNEAFTFIGNAQFSGNGTGGELRYGYDADGNTVVVVDVDGDGIRDMSIVLEGQMQLTADDFVL